MKDNSLLTQFASKVAAAQTLREEEADPLENLVSFSWLRNLRDRAVMLELRRKDGSVVALGYAWLEKISYEPSEGITLKFAGQTVKLIGRNLNAEVRPNIRLLAGLIRHCVSWVQEADEPMNLQAARAATVIERIEFE